jgi:O-antigen/teichoic acid export membrane protein
MVYCSRRRGQALAAYSGSTLIHQILLTALTMVGLLALAAMLGLGIGSESLLPVVWPLLGAVPFLLLREYLRSVSFAHLQIGAAMALDIAVAVLQLGGLLALTHFGALTVERVYLLMGGCCAAACLGWFWSKRQPLEFRRERIAADWRDNWSFARWTLAGQSLSRTSGFLIPWIVAAVHGEAATGVLAACITVVNLAGTFVTGVSNLLTPEASHTYVRGGARALGRLLWQIALLFILTVGGFALAMLMMGNWLAVFVFGDKFAGTGPILTLLAFSMFINSLGLTVGNGLWALDMPKANFRADLCVLVVTMLLVACLIYPLGVLGAAIAILGGTATGALMRAWILQRQLKNVA